MNIKPYNEIYLEDVESNIGSMLEYSACCEFDPTVIEPICSCLIC